MSKFCQTCGKPLADDMRFCDACGAPAPAAAPQQPTYQQPAYQQAPQQPAYQQPAYQQAPQQPAYQQPAYQQAPQQPAYQQAPQQPAYQQAPQQPAYQQPAYQQAPQQGSYQPAPAPTAAPAKPAKKGGFDLNKIFDQVKLFANGVVNRCKVDKKFMISCCAIAAAVLLVIILAIVLLAKPAYQKPIDTMINVTYKGKASQIKNLAPNEYWEYLEEENDVSIDDVIEEYEEEWDDMQEMLEDEFGKNIRVTYKIEKVKDLSDKKVEKIAEALDKQYDIDEKSVKAAKKLDVEMTIKGSEDDDDDEAEITVVKIGSKWYMINYYESGDNYRVYFVTGG